MEQLKLDPIYLTTQEVEYELGIRNVRNIAGTNRKKVSTLNELLEREDQGLENAPKHSKMFNPTEEIESCCLIFEDIVEKAEEAAKTSSLLELIRCSHRWLHLQLRLERIEGLSEKECVDVESLLDSTYDASFRVNKKILEMNNKKNKNTLLTKSNENESALIEKNKDKDPIIEIFDENRRDSLIDLNLLSPKDREDIRMEKYREARLSLNPKAPLFRPSIENPRQHEFTLESQRSEQLETSQSRWDKIMGLAEYRISRSNNDQNVDLSALRKKENVLPQFFSTQNRNFQPENNIGNINSQLRTNPSEQHDIYRSRQRNYSNDRMIPNRKYVPINQWPIRFSGDNRGMNLLEFLASLSMFQESERVSDTEMKVSVYHLLYGRARLWYHSIHDYLHSWQEVVLEMKKEFLPANYNYLLFCDILGRTQKSNETFGEYITHMQALFKCLEIPIAGSHKLFIVQRNLLPKYATSIAPLEIESLQHLIDACRRIDNAVSTSNRGFTSLPFQQYSQFSRQRSFSNNNNNHHQYNVNEVEEKWDAPEVNAMRRGDNNNRFLNRRSEATNILPNNNESQRCWNCNQNGHRFKDCRNSRNGVFCYRCGARDVVVNNCRKCAENQKQSSGNAGPSQNSAE